MPRVKKPKVSLRPTYLRQWRKFKKLTQEQAAEPLNIDATTLSRIERGESPYDQRFLEAAAKLYGCEPQDLLVRDPEDPEGIWTAWSNLRPAQRRQAIKLLKALEEDKDVDGENFKKRNSLSADVTSVP